MKMKMRMSNNGREYLLRATGKPELRFADEYHDKNVSTFLMAVHWFLKEVDEQSTKLGARNVELVLCTEDPDGMGVARWSSVPGEVVIDPTWIYRLASGLGDLLQR